MPRSALHDRTGAFPRPAPAAAQRHGGGALALVGRWLARRRQRRDLRELALSDDHLLKDIGLTREDALAEARKPFWR